jgi:hypothetical protein
MQKWLGPRSVTSILSVCGLGCIWGQGMGEGLYGSSIHTITNHGQLLPKRKQKVLHSREVSEEHTAHSFYDFNPNSSGIYPILLQNQNLKQKNIDSNEG